MGKKICTKKSFRTREDAVGSGARVRGQQLDLSGFRAYRCTICRFQGGKRAWHWGGFHHFMPRKR